jgi:hypothetical protein
MRELTVRALLHRTSLGERSSAKAAKLLIEEIDNPLLSSMVNGVPGLAIFR